ncbi:MAG: glycoside hydrolase family 36 protein [Anaerolineae bacterium]
MKNSDIPEGRPRDVAFHTIKRSGCQAVRYVSDTTVREEVLDQGRLVGLYWSAVGEVLRDVGPGREKTSLLQDPLVYPVNAFELEIDGQALSNHWDWVSAGERPAAKPGTVEAVVELRHQVRPVTVKVVTRLDGTPILARWLEITNTSDESVALSSVSPCCGMLWHNEAWWKVSTAPRDSLYSLGYEKGQIWGDEGDFIWRTLPKESLRLERSRGKNYGAPSFVVRNDVTGELFFVALAWSANWAAEFSQRTDGVLSFRLGPIGPAPIRVIAAGETVNAPEVHIGPMHRDYDETVNAWLKHMRTSVLPPRPKGKEMYTICGHVVEWPDEWILREIDIAHEMGVEAFMVDAGWYGDVFGGWTERRGDWYEGSWLPGGLAGIREYAHSKGMLLGLWMEPETMGIKSNLAAEHPDWFLTTDEDRLPGGVRALNLGKPEVAQFFEESVLRVIRDYKLDFFKLDYNIQVYEGGQNLREGYLENETWRHMEALYGTFDRVLGELPDVALENCAGGGGRNDLGMMSRFHYASESDFSHFPISIRAINGLTTFLPPDTLAYYHNHVLLAHLSADLDTHLRVTLFANVWYLGFGAQDADRTAPYFAKTKRYIALAKTFCYPIMAGHPLVYHHTPAIGVYDPAAWCVLEYGTPDRSRGYAGVFALDSEAPDVGTREYVLQLRGVDRSKAYDVTLDNLGETVRISGQELANSGLRIRFNGAMLSELVLYQVAD